jgi:hypothetical protein
MAGQHGGKTEQSKAAYLMTEAKERERTGLWSHTPFEGMLGMT